MNNDVTLHIRLPSEMKKNIEDKAREFSIKPAAVVRIAIEEYLDKQPQRTTRINLTNF